MSRWTKLTVLTLCSTLAWSCADSPLAPNSPELAKGGGGGGPSVDGTVPDSASVDTTLNIRVVGSGFVKGSVVKFLFNGEATPKLVTGPPPFRASATRENMGLRAFRIPCVARCTVWPELSAARTLRSVARAPMETTGRCPATRARRASDRLAGSSSGKGAKAWTAPLRAPRCAPLRRGRTPADGRNLIEKSSTRYRPVWPSRSAAKGT